MSLLDGMIRFDQLLNTAKAFGMDACAVTDHGNMFGAMEYYFMAKNAGVKPILGCEAYVAPRSRFDKKGKDDNAYHVILLAMDNEGYGNLIKLVSLANLEGFYYVPRIDRDLMRQHNKGIVCLTACLKGEVPWLLLQKKDDEALKMAEEYYEIFGDRLFFEIQENGLEEQRMINEGLARLSRHFNVPLVATNDCHYLRKEEARAHELLLCIQTGKTMNDANRLAFGSDEFYFKSPEEMCSSFSAYPEAVSNTKLIAEMCNVSFEKGNYHFPNFKVPEGQTTEQHFEDLCRQGYARKFEHIGRSYKTFTKDIEKKYHDRLEYELSVIKQTGFAGYFLIVTDFIRYAKSNDIPVGPGRGSAAGSLVSYCLDITNIDPIKYDLLFERFLNPERISMPDIDVDFCYYGREKVIQYVGDKYGKENVAQIITFGKMKSRAVVRDVGRVLSMPYADVDRIAKLIPAGAGSDDDIIKEVIKKDKGMKESYENDPKMKELLDYAMTLEGLTRHASTHAAGIVISNKPLLEYLPLYRGKEGEVLTQFTMKSVEDIGLIKFDLLGLKTLTVMDDAVKVLKRQGIDLDINSISVDDPSVFDFLTSGKTSGVFQLESSGMMNLIRKLQPTQLEELTALVALYRPGPLNSGMADEYVRRKNDPSLISYDTPDLEGILKETYGVMVYQEQVMKTAVVLAGFSMKDADGLRKAISKKIKEQMVKYRTQFIEGCVKNKVDQELASSIYDAIEKFGEYGFNKSHSAAYAYVAYQTAYLKTYHYVPFIAALITSDVNDTDKIIRYLNECRSSGVKLLPPDINESESAFTVVDDGTIRFGLSGIKGVGAAAIENILEIRREHGAFTSFHDFMDSTDSRKVNKKVTECLVKSGCFDGFGIPRGDLMHLITEDWGKLHKKGKGATNGSLFGNIELEPKKDIPAAAVSQEQLSKWEKEAFGFYFSEHPLNPYREFIPRLTAYTTENIKEIKQGDQVLLAGVVNTSKVLVTRRGQRMIYLGLEDTEGIIEIVVFPDVFAAAAALLESDRPITVTGCIERSEDGEITKVRAELIELLEDKIGDMRRNVVISIDIGLFSKAKLRTLKDVLNSMRGQAAVTLEFRNNERKMIRDLEGWGVDTSRLELIDRHFKDMGVKAHIS
jgi:DNA polymerase-3 subunit alpha